MRRFEDVHGRSWDVVVGRESWGTVVAIFVPGVAATDDPGGSDMPAVRQASLRSAAYAQANEELEALSEVELRELLQRSTPKNNG
jgi:hypothetical protein